MQELFLLPYFLTNIQKKEDASLFLKRNPHFIIHQVNFTLPVTQILPPNFGYFIPSKALRAVGFSGAISSIFCQYSFDSGNLSATK